MRRFIGSVDVEFNTATGAIRTEVAAPSTWAGGTKAPATPGVAEPLVGAAAPCQYVWLAARMADDGTSLNARPCLVGDAASQNVPILPANVEGLVLRVNDASKVFIRSVSGGDGVAYRIFA